MAFAFETFNLFLFLLASLGAFLAILLGLAVYRLYFSPLAKFPGRKMAALTLWYEFYWDVVKRGKYEFEIMKMHEEYGPIVRISPHELHVDAPSFHAELFAGGNKKRDKYWWATQLFGSSDAAIATNDHDRHRMRRAPLNRFFSKESIRRIEPIIQEKMQKLLGRLEGFKKNGQPVNVILLFSAFTSDIINEYAFAKPYDYLGKEDFDGKFFDMMVRVHEMGMFKKQFSWFLPLMEMLPDRLVGADPGMKLFIDFRKQMKESIRAVKEKRQREPEHYKMLSHSTVFHDILDSELPEREKTVERLWQEAQIISVAGTETTAWTLSVIMFYLLSDSNVLRKLREELEVALPNASKPVTAKELEQLKYLTAVIQEGLRLSFGVSTRLQRVCNEVLKFNDGKKDWEIPPGIPISMSGPTLHLNPEIFPSPYEFRPERWIENPRLDKYLCSFSKGSRQCLGINLAYGELYLCLAGVWRRYGGPGNEGPDGKFELFETDRSDVEYVYDLFVPFPKKGSKGVRISIK